ncbi:MAG: FAD-linked oxidase C-terminal domain-containing protein, partial [Myxococcota bacterium]|nr:FAD-linked oxidase C-terminal domain-containing protein [Myxococcota bacterium]
MCGGAAPLFGGIVVDLKHMDEIGPIERGSLQVTCGPGRILQNLEQDLNDHGLTLGHFPSSIYCASIGGCVAARGAGQLSSRYGKIEDMVTGLRVVTPDLGVVRTGSLDPDATTPDWTPLFLGSEGTLGLITAIRLRVHPLPEAMVLRGVRFPSVEAGLAAFREILQGGFRPSVMRLYDPLDTWMAMQKSNDDASTEGGEIRPGGGHPMLGGAREAHQENAVEPGGVPPQDAGTTRVLGSVVSPGTVSDGVLKRLRRRKKRHRSVRGEGLLSGVKERLIGERLQGLLKPENIPVDRLLANPALINKTIGLLPGRCLAIFGCEGEPAVAAEQLSALVTAAERLGGVDLGSEPGERWFRTRYHVSFKLPKLLSGGGFADTLETAVPWTGVQDLYDAVRRAVSPHALVMAHFSHAYHEGCSIYFTIVGYGSTPAKTDAIYERCWEAALEACVRIGATITHHHGVGVLKKGFMDREHGDSRRLFESARDALDSKRILNPGKLFPDERPAPGPTAEEVSGFALDTGSNKDGVVRAGVDWRGVDLAAELELRGHFLPPLGRPFLESTVRQWLGSRAVPAHVAVHGAWEHPLLAVEGRFEDGRAWRSGLLPRSAAGPSYLPFSLGTEGSDLALEPALVTFRTLTPPVLRQIGFVFGHMDRAILALTAALRGSPTPIAGAVFPGQDPSSWRSVAQEAPPARSGGVVFLTVQEPDGFPGGNQQIVDRLSEAGGSLIDDAQVLSWWEDHWAQAAREGSSALEETGICTPDNLIGRCRAVVPWRQALLLLRSIETLTGGATRAVGWLETPRETGCTLDLRFSTTRAGAEPVPLVPFQLVETIRAHGARIESMHFDDPGA